MSAQDLQRPLFDVVHPSKEALASSLHEHLHWSALSGPAEAALCSDPCKSPIEAVSETVLKEVRCAYHVLEKSVSFARCAFNKVDLISVPCCGRGDAMILDAMVHFLCDSSF